MAQDELNERERESNIGRESAVENSSRALAQQRTSLPIPLVVHVCVCVFACRLHFYYACR